MTPGMVVQYGSEERCRLRLIRRKQGHPKLIFQSVSFTPPPFFPTVMLIEMPRFYVGKLLLHHYKSDLAHLSDLYSLVIELYKSER